MTIVYLLRSYPRASQTFVLNEIRSMERLGMQVEVVALTRANDTIRQPVVDEIAAPVTFLDEEVATPGRALAAMGRVARRAPRRFLACVASVVRAREVDAGYTSMGRYRCLAAAAALSDRLARSRTGRGTEAVHVHAHFAHDPAYVALLTRRLTGTSYSFTGHARDLYQIAPGALAERVREAEFVATVTEHNRGVIRRAADGVDTPVHVIPQGTDTARFTPAPGRPPRPPALLAVGRLVAKKGFDVLLDACALLAADGRRFHCTIVGEGPAEGALRTRIGALGLADRVTMAGPVPQDDLVAVYRGSDAFVLPATVTADGDSDALPTVLLEAMACGLVVVTTPVGGIAELVTDGADGLLVPSDDAPALAATLARLLDDPDLAARLGAAGRRTAVERFDHGDLVARLAGLLAAVTRSHVHTGGRA